MHSIRISDVTMKQSCAAGLTFKEKLELVKLLDKLEVDVIETTPIVKPRADALCIKSIAQTVRSIVAVPVPLDTAGIDTAWDAVCSAKRARLQVHVPVSSVQMEYMLHMKPDAVRAKACEAVTYCKSLCADVEFIAQDATRADRAFLYGMLAGAIEAGATTVTVEDAAGTMLPEEFRTFIEELRGGVAGIERVTLGVSCSDALSMADICSVTGAAQGAGEIKTSAYAGDTASLQHVVRILEASSEKLGVSTSVRTVEISRVLEQTARIFTMEKSKKSPFEDGVRDDRQEKTFTAADDITTIIDEIRRLGYDLDEEDHAKVYETFKAIASRKDSVTSTEIDTMVASTAMQVPSTYVLEDYVINSGSSISATAHIRLTKHDEMKESVAMGDGPIDAAFIAIEHITGHHYELDDFQIQAVTEGHEAMGETVVRLRSDGRLYSGRGLSTDIIGSGICAYINALNKIAYEEENA